MGKTYKDRKDYHEKGGKRAFMRSSTDGLKRRNPIARELRNPMYRPRRKKDKRNSMIDTLEYEDYLDERNDLPKTIPISTRLHNIQD